MSRHLWFVAVALAPLSAVADIEIVPELANIPRRHGRPLTIFLFWIMRAERVALHLPVRRRRVLCVELQQYTIPGAGGARPEGKPTEYQVNYRFAHLFGSLSMIAEEVDVRGIRIEIKPCES